MGGDGDQSGLSKNLVLTTSVLVFGSPFLFGWNLGVLNQPVELIRDFYNVTYTERYGELSEGKLVYLWSLTNAIYLPGALIGALLGGTLADKFGRKRIILFSHLFTLLGAALACACVKAEAPEMLMISRFLFGINTGLGNCLCPMFLSEISTKELRGALGTTNQLSVTIGLFLASVFGLKQILGTPGLWPYLMLLEAVPALLTMVLLPFFPDPPPYLLLHRRDEGAARRALQFYRGRDDVSAEMAEMSRESRDTGKPGEAEDTGTGSYSIRRVLTDPALRHPLLVACALQVIQQYSGANAIFFYSTGIYINAGVSEAHAPYAVIATNFVNVLATCLAVFLMDRAGRRRMLLIPMCVIVGDLAVLVVAFKYQVQVSWLSYVSVVACNVFVCCYAVGLAPIPWMISSEFFRQGPRAVAMATASVCNWVSCFILALSFESMQIAFKEYTFVFHLVLVIVFTMFVKFCVPETRHRTFDEIARAFSGGWCVTASDNTMDGDEVESKHLNQNGKIQDTEMSLLNSSKEDQHV